MINKLCISDENIYEKIDHELLLNGFAVIKDFGRFYSELFKGLIDLYEKNIYTSKVSYYEGGFCKRYEELSTKSKNIDILNKLVSNSLVQNVAIKNLNTKKFHIDVFQTFDNKETNHVAYNPHFDRIPTLKFLLYLNDIEIENGSFCISPGSHHWVQKNFPLPRDKYNSDKFLRKSRDLPPLILNKLEPISGAAGQLLIFYTDCVHNQGKVKSGETKITRVHFRNPFIYTNKDKNYLLHQISKFAIS